MKKSYVLLLAMAVAGVALAEAPTPGPTGGKLLENAPPRAEFFVNAERKVEVRMFDEQLKPVPAAGQVVSVIAEAPSGRTTLALTNSAGMLVSTAALPEGDGYNVVVQIRETAEARPQNFRVALHMETCGECQRAEYACTCDHADGADEHGHKH